MEAFVTLVTQDSYAVGAIVLAHSLRDSGTTRKVVVMVTPDVSKSIINELGKIFDDVHMVNLLDSKDVVRLGLLKRPELGVTLTKVELWTLTQYKKVVFFDADTLVLKNVDDLFERPELSAAPDVGWPDCFNSGVFVAVPSMDTHRGLLEMAASQGSFDGGDQGLLNQYFSGWSTDQQRRLPFLYNVVPGTYYGYAPAYAHFKDDIKVAHFIGDFKPWRVGRPTGTAPGDGNLLLIHWWAVHDAHAPSNLPPYPGSFTTPSQTASGASASSSEAQPSHPPGGAPQWTQLLPHLPEPTPSGTLRFEGVSTNDLAAQADELSPAQRHQFLQSLLNEVRTLNAKLVEEKNRRPRSEAFIEATEERVAELTRLLIKWRVY